MSIKEKEQKLTNLQILQNKQLIFYYFFLIKLGTKTERRLFEHCTLSTLLLTECILLFEIELGTMKHLSNPLSPSYNNVYVYIK